MRVAPPGWTAPIVLAAAVAAMVLPLATYVLTLATFGMIHVLVELRYVDRRFSSRLPRGVTTGWLVVLACIVLIRLATMATPLDPTLASMLEVSLVGALALAVLPILRGAEPLKAALVLAVAAALLAGAFAAPLLTLVVLAVLHNVTPVGFLAERLRGRERASALLWCAVLFCGVPVLIGSGVGAQLLEGIGLTRATWEPFESGGLRSNLGVFVPEPLVLGARAVDLFSAAVYLQCLHYAVVIGVLPRLEPDANRDALWVSWPRPQRWRLVLIAVAVVSLAAYAFSFRDARAFYGLFALVHAWVEVPVLLAALTPLPEPAA